MQFIIINLFLVVFVNFCTSRPSPKEDSEWVKDMLQLGSQNGKPSLKAPIIPPKNNEQGRSLGLKGKGRSGSNLPLAETKDNNNASNSNPDMNQPKKPQALSNLQNNDQKIVLDHFERHYDEEEFEDLGPDFTMNENKDDKVRPYVVPGPEVYMDHDDETHDGDEKLMSRSSKRKNAFVPVEEQQAKVNRYPLVNLVGDTAGQLDHLSMGNPYYYPIQQNRLVRWRNQENVLVGAYKRLTDINRRKLEKVNPMKSG